MTKRPKRMKCCCCGGTAWGRQWWNQDTGTTLCKACVEFVKTPRNGHVHTTDEDMARSYGVLGLHYGCDEPTEVMP